MMNKNFDSHHKNVPKKLHKNTNRGDERNSSYGDGDAELPHRRSHSKENVELSLEVEIADSLRQLLSKPENCTSRLLDVTVIKPAKDANRDSRVETNTVAFGKDDIKDLLTIIETQSKEQNDRRQRNCRRCSTCTGTRPKYEFKTCKRHEAAQRRTACVRSAPSHTNQSKPQQNPYPTYLRNVEARLVEICNNNNNNNNRLENTDSQADFDFSSDSNGGNRRETTTIGDGSKAHHIYATAHTFDSLRKTLACQNKQHCLDGKTPCLCERCGTLGVLVDSQKGPVLSNAHAPVWSNGPTPHSPKTASHSSPPPHKGSRYVDLRSKHKNEYTLHNIGFRLDDLEERLDHQEENAVSKEYFKKIMGKLIAYCHSKGQAINDRDNDKSADVRDNAAQCNFNRASRYSCKRDVKLSTINNKGNYKPTEHAYCVNSLTLQCESECSSRSDNYRKSKEAKSEPKKLETFWKWGEEIIKPGVDLKTKIVTLLDEKLNSMQASATGGEQTNKKCKNRTKCCQIDRCSTCSLTNALMEESSEEKAQANEFAKRSARKKSQINLTKSQFEPILMKHTERCMKPLHVAYVSPNVKNWRNESATSVARVKVKDNATQIGRNNNNNNDDGGGGEAKIVKKRLNVQDSLQDKLNCLRELAKSRNVDEHQLWRNIWHKVKDHARTKHDTVTIQIPTETLYKLHKGANQISEIELTITDLFDIVVRSKEESVATLDIDTRSVINNRKRLEEIHKQLGVILNKQLSKS